MYLERLLQINMAALASLGALLLGMGQRSLGLPMMVMAAAATSVWITDIKRWFSLGRWTANLLMVVAAVYSLHNIFPLGTDLQAISFIRMLICLQIILLFQRKLATTYWLLVVLSLLEVVLASLFSQGVFFGVLLAIYMLVGLSAMTLLSLHGQVESQRAAAGKTVWEGHGDELIGLLGGSGRSAVGTTLFKRLGIMGFHTLIVTLLLFFALPRFAHVSRRGAAAQPHSPHSMVGFSDEVKLGELGQIIESREKVMQVRLLRKGTKSPGRCKVKYTCKARL